MKQNPLNPKQRKAIRESVARINIFDGAVRSGKTVAAMWRWAKYIGNAPPGDLAMVGKSIGSLYRNMVRPMQELLGSQMHYSSGKHEIDIWGRKIFCFGAYDESSEGILRGMTVAGALGDELTLWPKSFFMTLLGRLSVKGSQLFGTTNTDSPYHYIKTDFLDRISELNLYNLHFILDDNPTLDPEYVASLKKEYVGLWFKRFILGLWVMAEGAIYDFFDEDIHTIVTPRKALTRSVAVDYGTGNPTCFIMFGENPQSRPVCWAEKEYYYDSKLTGKQKTDDEYVEDFFTFIGDYPITDVYPDPSALSFITALKKKMLVKGKYFNIVEVDNSVVDGIRVQASMLKSGSYTVCKQCKTTIQDYGAYLWDAKAQKQGEDKPLKQHDHTKDPERYYLYNKYGLKHLDYAQLTTW